MAFKSHTKWIPRFIGSVVLLLFAPAVYAGTMAAWSGEVEMIINNSSNAGTLTNYQILLTLNTQGLISNALMASDGKDIRFTSTRNNDATLLDYWIQSDTISTATTRIWVEVATIAASANTTIYMYYGNAAASAVTSGPNTFVKFVNFNTDGVISHGRQQDAQPGNFQIQDGGHTLRLYGNNWKATSASLTLSNNYILDLSFKDSGVLGEINGVGFDKNTNGLNQNWFYRIQGTQSWGAQSTSPMYSGSGNFEDLSAALDDFTGNFSYLIFANDADAGQSTNVFYRDVRIRKLTNPEPTVVLNLPITQLGITTSAQSIFQGTTSSVITVQAQNILGSAQNVTSNTTIQLSSSSGTGAFSLSSHPFTAVSSLTIPGGSASASFYYRDSSVGTPTITAAESPSQSWTDGTQSITINDLQLGPYTIGVVVDHSACGSSKTDFQTLLPLNTQALVSSGKMKANGDDIRILDADNATPLRFWIQTGTMNSTNTKIWINIPSLPALASKTIFLRYGHASAVAMSNPDATFIEFLNFNTDGVISYGGGQDRQSENFEIQENGRTLRMYGNNWKASATSLVLSNNQRIDFSFKNTGTQAEINGVGLDTKTNGLSPAWFYQSDGTQAWGRHATSPVYSGSGSFEELEIVLDDFTGTFTYFVFANDADAGQNTNVFYRDVRVRKYSSCEPAVTLVLPIAQLAFTTAPQTVLEDRVSSVITVQSQNELAGAQNVNVNTTVSLSSSSAEGQFSLTPSPFNPITSLTILSGGDSVSFYYRDPTAGTVTLTAGESPSQGWTDATQSMVISTVSLTGNYQRAVIIDNSHCPASKSNYQILVSLDTQSLVTAGKMQSNGEDIRFFDSDGSTPLSYWIQSDTINTSTTRIWVKVPAIPAAGSKTILMHYGNPTATAASDPDQTFIKFLNFNVDGVVTYGRGQDRQPGNFEIQDNGRTLRMFGNNWKVSAVNLSLGRAERLDFSFKNIGATAEINGIGFDTETAGLNANWFYKAHGSQNWGSFATSPMYTGSGQFENLSAVLEEFSGSFAYIVFANDADAGQSTNVFYRDVRIRKHDSCEPSVSLQAEQKVISKLVFTTAPQTLVQNQVSGLMTIEAQNFSDVATTVSSNIQIDLESTSLGGQFAPENDSTNFGTSNESSITMSAGESTASFYYRDTVVGSPTITASENPAQGWTDATQQQTINPVVNSFIVSVASPQVAGVAFPMTVTALDDNGAIATDFSGTVIITANVVSPQNGSGGLSVVTTSVFLNGTAIILDQSFSDCGTITMSVTWQEDPTKTGVSNHIILVPFDFVVSLDQLDGFASHTVNHVFQLQATARNARQETCVNYQGAAEIAITNVDPASPQQGTISPATTDPENWTQGVLTLDSTTYDRWGSIKLNVTDAVKTTQTGVSETVTFVPKSFVMTLSAPPASRDFYYLNESFSVTVSPVDFNEAVIPNYQGAIAITATLVDIPETYTFTAADLGTHVFTDAFGSLEGQGTIFVVDQFENSVTGQSDIVDIRAGKIQVLSNAGPVGSLGVQVQVLDSGNEIITEDDATTFLITIDAFIGDAASATSEATTIPVTMTHGVASISITDTEPDTLIVTPVATPVLEAIPGVIRFGTVSGSGVGLDLHRELP